VALGAYLAVLEVVKEDVETLGLDAVIFHNNAGAAHDLARVALTVDLAETGPSAKNLSVTNLDEVDLVLGTESLNELDILGLSASLDEDGKMGLAFVERLGTLAQTTRKTVVNERVLQNLLHDEMRCLSKGAAICAQNTIHT
jgi:hypothetical protein